MSQGSVLQGKYCLSIPSQILPSLPCGLGLVQDLTFIMTPPPHEVLHGVFTVDQGLGNTNRGLVGYINIYSNADC